MNKTITGIVSDAFGIVIWVFSLVLLYQEKIDLVWEGIVYMVAGSVFFFVGESAITPILKKLLHGLTNIATKQNGSNDQPQL